MLRRRSGKQNVPNSQRKKSKYAPVVLWSARFFPYRTNPWTFRYGGQPYPALLIPPILPARQYRPDGPIRTTVCEVLENPSRFTDRPLEIRAELIGQSTLLHDPGCTGALAFDLPTEKSLTNSTDYYKLRRYLEHPGVATATIVGMCGLKGNPHGGTFMCAALSVRDVQRVKGAK